MTELTEMPNERGHEYVWEKSNLKQGLLIKRIRYVCE